MDGDVMRDKVVKVRYSNDKNCCYEIVDREDGTFQVWIQKKIVNETDDECFYYCDIKDYAHITDSISKAIEIGDEMLRNII
ncbi:hypothetical protein FDG75_15720 [Clostridium botulinum]|nr:hypothetical protein [Clostridium botulinum]